MPVGGPTHSAEATVAVKVTAWPGVEGLGDEVRAGDRTMGVNASAPGIVLPVLKLPSPLYVAVMKCWRADNVELVYAAWPLPFRGTLDASVTVSGVRPL